jgi:hypothetical protein
MNPVGKFLLSECAESRAGFLVVPAWKCEDYASQEIGSDPTKHNEVHQFKKRVIKYAGHLGIWVI